MKSESVAARKVLVAIASTQAAYYRGIGRYAREHDWHLIMDTLYTGSVPDGWNGDGIIALPAYNRQVSALVRSSAVPCVSISHNAEATRGPRVEGDHHLIGRLAADHFLERGYQHFAWAPFVDDAANQSRLRGFLERLQELGGTCRVLSPGYVRNGLHLHQNWSERRARLTAEIRRLPLPTAVFAFNDCVASDVVDACRDAGLAVPEQIAVLGVDDEPLICDGAGVPISSIQHDLEQIGYSAAGLLDRLMNGGEGALPDVPVTRVAPRGVTVRVSTDMLAVANARVAQALRYIAQHFPNPMLSVAAIATAVGVSRRHLERMFRTELSCTIKERIVQTRMQAAAHLLKAHPDVRMPDVAQSVGLNEPKNFFRAFRRFFQTTPQAYRQNDQPARAPDRLPADEPDDALPLAASHAP